MEKKSSTTNLADFAHHAVNSLRRLVGSGGDSYTPAQQDLVSSSRQIEERWHRRRMPVDTGTVEMWCAGFRDELGFLTSPREVQEVSTRKPLTESAMVSALETARILSRTARLTAAEHFVAYGIVPLLVKYFMTVPLSKKLRDLCAVVLAEVPGDHLTLMAQCIEASLPFLLILQEANPTPPAITASSVGTDEGRSGTASPSKEAAEVAQEGRSETITGPAPTTPAFTLAVDTRAVYLAGLLVSAIHRADAVAAAEMVPRDLCPADGAIELLQCAHQVAVAPAVSGNTPPDAAAAGAGAGADSDGYQLTVVVVYLALLSGFVRGHGEVKARLAVEYREAFCRIWCSAVSNLEHMDTILSLPTTTPGRNILTPLPNSQTWRSELLELLIEVVTDDSFTLRRLSASGVPEGTTSPIGSGGEGSPSNAPRSPGQTVSPSGAGFGVRRFEPIPPHWDTILTGGSELVWRTASHLSACLIRPEAVGTLEHCLLALDTGSVFAESMYRNIIATLMLLCVADPHNAKRLADNAMFECLVALVTNTQESVFSSAVQLPRCGGGGTAVTVSPTGQLTTNTTQLTESFMCSLASVYFPRDLVNLLMRGVAAMSRERTCQTDADIVEALLHVLSTTFMLPSVLFFPGHGSVVCKVDGFPGRWAGYSFSAWVNPMCVWAEGSHLFSFSDGTGASVALSVVANGRSCCLALHVQTARDKAVAVIPESGMAAESWSHIVFTQGLSGVAVFVNGRKLPPANVSVPFPQAPSKRHRLDLAFGGVLGEPSFYGYVATMDLLEQAISEKDVAKLFMRGPCHSEASGFHPMLSVSAPATTTVGDGEQYPSPVSITGSLFKKRDGVSLHGVVALCTPDMQSVFAECGVMSWALQTLKASHAAANFSIIAKLCVSFIASAMRMASTDAELNAVLGSPDGAVLDALTAEVLTWEEAFLELPAILLSAATPRDGGKALRDHPSTQAILSLLLDRLEAVCACARGGAGGAKQGPRPGPLPGGSSIAAANNHSSTGSSSSNNTNSGFKGTSTANYLASRNIMSACSILRELSDCLLVEENVRLFKSVAGRFDRILTLSLYLPTECINSVVVLLEKLCKSQLDLERTLRFLVQPPPSTALGDAVTVPTTTAAGAGAGGGGKAKGSSAAPLSASLASLVGTNADSAKAEILRMLFDVARADVSMCDTINACFKGTGSYFLILLVNGKNHTSEAVRVFSLRLLSLMMHVNRKFREGFVKSHGFAVLSRAITDPGSRVPIRLPTVDCLFQMAFDGYRPTDGADSEMASRLSTGSQPASKGKSKKSKHHDPMGAGGGGGLGRNLGLPGHLPGLVSRRLKLVRREYSFEVAHDFARVDDRLQFDETYRSKSAHSVLHVPPAFETALSILGQLVALVGTQLATAAAAAAADGSAFVAVAGTDANGNGGEWDGANHNDDGRAAYHSANEGAEDEDVRRCGSSVLLSGVAESVATPGGGGGGGVDGNSSVSSKSPIHEEEALERVVARVLSYLEKVTDVEGNGVALLQYPWMDWLWSAVQGVAVARRGNTAAASPSSPVASGRYSRKFSSMVMSHTRHIIRKLVVLDMARNSKAVSIRRLRGIQHPPYLLRIVLEEVVRHFTKGKQEMSDPRGASNVIKNLATLFHHIEHTLDPLPLPLGTEIVSAISVIAVRNNSWVRMRMKKDSDLFETRDRLAFHLLVSVKWFAKADSEVLSQLVDANSNELGATVVLLARLSRAVDGKDLDEVETLLLLIRRLTTYYEDQLREVYKQLGSDGEQLAELLCVTCEDVMTPSSRQGTTESFVGGGAAAGNSSSNPAGGAPSSSSPVALTVPPGGGYHPHSGDESSDSNFTTGDVPAGGGPSTSRVASSGNPLADDGLFGGANSAGGGSAGGQLPISQVVEWCHTHSAQWATIADGCRQRAAKLTESHLKANKDRVEKEQNAVAKATRSQMEHQEQLDARVTQELARIRSEVMTELGSCADGNSSSK